MLQQSIKNKNVYMIELVHYGQAETAKNMRVIELYKNLKETLILQMIVY